MAEPQALPVTAPIDLPESRSYRVKRKILGPSLATDQLEHERLGNPTALAVFSSDALSSTAYATEEIIRVLVPVIGFAAFSSYVLPITLAMAAVLAILIFSYRQTIKAYPSAGGAYVVTKDNIGLLPAQVAGVSLLTDYILTVAVSVSAGVAAVYSAVPAVYPYRVPIALSFILIIALGNLRGVKESGQVFAVPTYAFLVSMVCMITFGVVKMVTGNLPVIATPPAHHIEIAGQGGLALGSASIFLVLHAFASGGAAVTGVEAISNGVSAFRKPEWKNAQKTLAVMGVCLGFMFIGISILAAHLHTIPSEKETVLSQIARAVVGDGAAGNVAFAVIQVATVLILVLAANTSFADFPRLASFQAGDSFLPKQLTKRGHRLVFSNGIISLSLAAAALVLVFEADVSKLIPLYAIGVFTSFTLSQAGMAKHHIRLKEPGWKVGLFINGLGAVVTFVVAIVIGATKFKDGAWFIIILVPILVAILVRLNKQYVKEDAELESEAKAAAEAPILRRHSVIVLVEKLDRSSARAVQYARTLTPDELRAVHVAYDLRAADELAEQWRRLGLQRLPLELVDCSDRRIDRAVLEVVAEDVADGSTEVSLLIPRREYRGFWHRILHDRTAESIARAMAGIPHVNVTFVPYQLGEHHPVAVEEPSAPKA
jgi:amino acid transporter